jgi:S-adenosylmethionine:diacylglycerol 3-amino-3-carboxypropyl transferase
MAARGRDPAQFRWVSDVDVSGQLWDRLRWVCTELPTRGNFYLHAFFFGSYGEALPPHLSDEGHARLAPLVERVKVHVGDLSRLLGERRPGTFTHANLSDMFEYQSPAQSQDAMTRLGENLRGGGRVAFWNFLVARAPGPEQDALVRLDALSDELWRRDRSWFYRAFHVAEVAR